MIIGIIFRRILFYLFFTLFSSQVFPQQPILSWLDKEPNTFPTSIRTDSKGNILVVGELSNVISTDYIVLYKYTSSGTLLWTRYYYGNISNCFFRAFDMEVDSMDNIYLAGTIDYYCLSGDAPQGFLFKYNSSGALLWDKFYGAIPGLAIYFKALEVYENKFIYVTGKSNLIGSGNAYQSFTARYDSSGNQNWTRTLSNPYETSSDFLALDKIGNIYSLGTTECCLPGIDFLVYKLDSLGNSFWNEAVLDSTIGYAQLLAIAIDDSANILLGGKGIRAQGFNGYEFLLCKVDSSGAKRWSNLFTDSIVNDNANLLSIRPDKLGNCYISGNMTYTISGDLNGFAAKFSQSGSLIWKDVYDGPGHDDDGFKNGVLLNDSNYVVTGGGTYLQNTTALVLRSYNNSGIINWTYENPNSCYSDFAILGDSSIYCTGIFDGTQLGVPDSIMTCRLNLNFLNYIENNSLPKSFKIFPNPFLDRLTISSTDKSNSSSDIVITDLLGKTMYQEFNVTLPFSIKNLRLKAGIYLLQILSDKKIEKFKIVKY